MRRLYLLAAISLFGSVAHAGDELNKAFEAFRRQIDGLELRPGTEGRSTFSITEESDEFVRFSVKTLFGNDGAFALTISGLEFGFKATDATKLEKLNQWNWSQTDNLGRDKFRYTKLFLENGAGRRVSQIVVSFEQDSGEIVSIQLLTFHLKDKVSSLSKIKFADVYKTTQDLYCFKP